MRRKRRACRSLVRAQGAMTSKGLIAREGRHGVPPPCATAILFARQGHASHAPAYPAPRCRPSARTAAPRYTSRTPRSRPRRPRRGRPPPSSTCRPPASTAGGASFVSSEKQRGVRGNARLTHLTLDADAHMNVSTHVLERAEHGRGAPGKRSESCGKKRGRWEGVWCNSPFF